MSAPKAWAVSLLVGILWVVGSAPLIREMWETTPMQNGLFISTPAVLIVMVLGHVVQLRGRNVSEEIGSDDDAGELGSPGSRSGRRLRIPTS